MPNLHTVSSSDPAYVCPLIGNGEIVTSIGHSGYHTNDENFNHTVVWAGRRFPGLAISSLLRLGRFTREIVVNGSPSVESSWEQEVVPQQGMVVSRLQHELISERTSTFVHAADNAIIVLTELANTSSSPVSVSFVVRYVFGDYKERLHPGETVGVEPMASGARVRYELGEHLGSVEVRSSGEPVVDKMQQGVTLTHKLELQPGESRTVWSLFGCSDRRKYYNVVERPDVPAMVESHKKAWKEFYEKSSVDMGSDELKALYDNCLYTLRCNATPWSIPPAVLPGLWEGRTFHDELFCFLGLASCGHVDLASRIPYYRLRILPQAIERTGGRGARFPWESNEDGTEGGPYGPWMDEHFHVGQIVENAWRYCAYAGGEEVIREFYPMFEAAADYFVLNLVEEVDGELRIRPCTDFDEMISPVPNGLYTVCAAIRSMEIAAAVAEKLDVQSRKRSIWLETASRLRAAVPVAPEGDRFLTCQGAKHRHVAELGPAFPFATHLESDVTRNTLVSYMEECRSDIGWKPGSLPQYDGSRWMWNGSHLSSALSAIGEGERAYKVVSETVYTSGPAFSPAEQTRAGGQVGCPWFTTGAGAFVYAVNALFIQAGHGVTHIFPAIPESLKRFSFNGLAGAERVRVSAAVEDGKVVSLSIFAETPTTTGLTVPRELLADAIRQWTGAKDSVIEGNRILVTAELEAGENKIV